MFSGHIRAIIGSFYVGLSCIYFAVCAVGQSYKPLNHNAKTRQGTRDHRLQVFGAIEHLQKVMDRRNGDPNLGSNNNLVSVIVLNS